MKTLLFLLLFGGGSVETNLETECIDMMEHCYSVEITDDNFLMGTDTIRITIHENKVIVDFPNTEYIDKLIEYRFDNLNKYINYYIYRENNKLIFTLRN